MWWVMGAVGLAVLGLMVLAICASRVVAALNGLVAQVSATVALLEPARTELDLAVVNMERRRQC